MTVYGTLSIALKKSTEAGCWIIFVAILIMGSYIITFFHISYNPPPVLFKMWRFGTLILGMLIFLIQTIIVQHKKSTPVPLFLIATYGIMFLCNKNRVVFFNFCQRIALVQIIVGIIHLNEGVLANRIEFFGSSFSTLIDLSKGALETILPNAYQHYFIFVIASQIAWMVFLTSLILPLLPWKRIFHLPICLLSFMFDISANNLLTISVSNLLSPSETFILIKDKAIKYYPTVIIMSMAGGTGNMIGVYTQMGIPMKALMMSFVVNFLNVICILPYCTYNREISVVQKQESSFKMSVSNSLSAWSSTVISVFLSVALCDALLNIPLLLIPNVETWLHKGSYIFSFPLLFSDQIDDSTITIVNTAIFDKFFKNDYVALSSLLSIRSMIPTDSYIILCTFIYGFTNFSLLPAISQLLQIANRPSMTTVEFILYFTTAACSNFITALITSHYLHVFALSG